MKKSLIVLALLAAAGAASAQDNSASAASQAGSASQAGASSGSSAAIILNQNVPDTQNVNSTSTGTVNENVKYSGTVENKASGGYTNTDNTNIRYSGTQTVKNVPGIAMSGPASGPCTGVSGGVGVAGPGFGVGVNGSSVDDGCTVRENTRVLGQLHQSLDSADPAKAQAKAALMKSMAILEAMNDKIAKDYIKPQPEPKKAEAAPAAAPKVAEAPAPAAAPQAVKPAAPQAVASNAGVTMVAPPKQEPTDPFIRARMGLPKL